MLYKYNKKLLSNSQELRSNMTEQERKLWYLFLKKLPLTVNRQKIIGNYIVDFFIADKRIVIELDGIQHLMKDNKSADKQRDADLQALGITVLRYPNEAVNDRFNIVCEDILKHLELNPQDLKK